MDKLHPGARWLFRANVYLGLIGFIFFIGVFSIALFTEFGYVVPLIGFGFIIFLFIITEIFVRMSYNRWKYKFEPGSLRIEHGIIWKKYVSIPYERVQNVDIKRGIIARMFGFSTVDIETAGRSGGGAVGFGVKFGNNRHQQYKSEGHLPAISTLGAEKIRDFVMKKITRNQ